MAEKQRILVIDDDTASLTSIKMILGIDYDVITISNPSDILNLLQKDKFHLILLDMFIPGSDGMEILKQIRTNHKDIPVIILSGSVEWAVRVGETRRLGATDYILKPFDTIALKQRITEVLKN